jgi:hypothetical protein
MIVTVRSDYAAHSYCAFEVEMKVSKFFVTLKALYCEEYEKIFQNHVNENDNFL